MDGPDYLVHTLLSFRATLIIFRLDTGVSVKSQILNDLGFVGQVKKITSVLI